MTEFIQITDYPNYEINSLGEVRNITTQTFLGKTITRKGYSKVKLSKNNVAIRFYIHRLIALAFIPNPDEKPFIDHIDRNRLNNSITNLRWVTCAENCQNASVQKNSKSGVAGVTFQKKSNLWRATRQNRYLGSFKTMEEAINCRNNSEYI